MTNSTPTNYQKHQTTNPVQRYLLDRFNERLMQYIRACGEIRNILDVGCGEGFSLSLIQKSGIKAKLSGVDASKESLALGKKEFPHLDLSYGDIYALKAKDASYDLVLCTEVLEHLENPEKALRELRRVSRTYAIISVPHEPWFMLANFLRGKYVSRWGNHPEHINHWTRQGILQLLRAHGFRILKCANPFAWTIVLAQRT